MGNSDTIVYCKNCGAVPGEPSSCPCDELHYPQHTFVTGNKPVYCENCGAVPGKPTKCPHGYLHYPQHDFVSAKPDQK